MHNGHVRHVALPDLGLWKDVIGSRRVPFSFDLELTARCNNDCRHCCINLPASDRTARASELSLAEIERLADDAVELGALWCLVTGGEPLLRDDFDDIYLALKRRGLLVSVFTNGCLVRPRHVELFRRFPPRDLEVTLYGATAQTYEAVTRTPSSFAAFERGLGRLLDGGVKVRLKAMALKSSLRELPAIAAFCRAHTCDYFRFDPVLHLRYDRDPSRNEDIRAERLDAREVIELERADPERSEGWRDACAHLVLGPESAARSGRLFRCAAGVMSFAVGPTGRFRLCPSLTDPSCTFDLRHDGSLRQAWEEFVPSVRERSAVGGEYVETCGKCGLINLCSWCPAHAYLETGSLETRVPHFCEIASARSEVFSST